MGQIRYSPPTTYTGPVKAHTIGGGQTIDQQISDAEGRLKRAKTRADQAKARAELERLKKAKKGKK